MTMLEESLREALAEQAQRPPVLDDLATAAIRRGRQVKRRRTVAGVLVGVLAVAGAFGGTLSLQGIWQEPTSQGGVLSPVLPPPEPEPTPSPGLVTDGPLDMELRVVNRVWTKDRGRQQLSAPGLVEQAYRTSHGLVYGSDGEIHLRRDDGTAVELAADVGDWVLSPDGSRIAFTTDRDLVVAAVTGDMLDTQARTAVPADTAPVRFWDQRVVLSGPDGYDLWDPDAGSYQAAWTDRLVTVYGPRDGDLLALADGPDGHCLTVVEADAKALSGPGEPACPQRVPVEEPRYGSLSPDGNWLAVPSDSGVLLLEVSALRDGDAEPVACPGRDTVAPAWQDNATLLTADDQGAVSCDVRGEVQRLALPKLVGSTWDYVPTLRETG